MEPHLQRIDIGFTTAGLENTGPFRELIRFYEIDYCYGVYVLYAPPVAGQSDHLLLRKLFKGQRNERAVAVENGLVYTGEMENKMYRLVRNEKQKVY